MRLAPAGTAIAPRGRGRLRRAARAVLDRPLPAGAALVAGAGAWNWIASLASGGDPLPAVALLLASFASWAASRRAAGWLPWLPPALVAGAGAAILAGGGDTLSGGPLSGPFGYANATAAFFVQAAAAALMLAALARPPAARWAAACAAAAFAAVPALVRSDAGLVLAGAVVVAAAVSRRPRGASAAAACAGLALAGALAFTGAVAAGAPGERVFGERRPALWRDAAALIHRSPLLGVGPGRFAEESPVARSDPDARRAHHGFLQQGAESGVPGMGLLLALFAWALAAGVRRGSGGLGAIAAAAVAALGVHATVDYVLHVPAVALAAAALAGTAAGRSRPTETERR